MSKTEEWGTEQAKRIGHAVTRLRGERSGLWLSNETAKAGHRISRTSIHELETGKRKTVSTAELCVLGWSLKVPPVQLLYPEMPDGGVEIVPGIAKPSIEAAQWFSGELPYAPEDLSTDDARQETIDFHRGAQLVRLSRERLFWQRRVATLSGLVLRLKQSGQGVAEILVDLELAEKQLQQAGADLRLIESAVVSDDG